MATEYTIFGNSKPSGLGEYWDPHTFSANEYPLNRVRATDDGWELLGVRFYILVNQTLPDLYFVAFTTPSGTPDRQSDAVQSPSGEGWVEAYFDAPLPMPKNTYIYVGIGSQGASGTWSATSGGNSATSGALEITRTEARVVVNGSGQDIGAVYLGYDIIAAQTQTPAGTATGTVAWITSASGSITATGAASAPVEWTGSASGKSPNVPVSSGTATGTLDWSHATTGIAAPTGAATGIITWSGVAVGSTELVRDIWVTASAVETGWQIMAAVPNPIKGHDVTRNPMGASDVDRSDWAAGELIDTFDRWQASDVYIQRDKEPTYGG